MSFLPDADSAKLDKFAYSLVSMDARIKLFYAIGDISGGDSKCYIPSKKMLAFTYNFPTLAHEIAHVVEVSDFARLTKTDFGMRIFGRARHTHPFYRPTDNGFFAGMAREVRVRSIERHIDPTKPISILANRGWSNHAASILPFGRFKTMKDVEVWVLDMAERTRKVWDKERIRSEWVGRLDYIRNWMETEEKTNALL